MSEKRNEEFEEFEERAAIREYGGGFSKDQAEILAITDIAERARLKEIPQKSAPDVGCRSQADKRGLSELVKQRNDLGEKMRAETNHELKQQMLEQWMQLNQAIIKMKKEC